MTSFVLWLRGQLDRRDDVGEVARVVTRLSPAHPHGVSLLDALGRLPASDRAPAARSADLRACRPAQLE